MADQSADSLNMADQSADSLNMADQSADSLNMADQSEEEGQQSDDSLAEPLQSKTEEQLIAEAFGQVKVLVEAGQQEGYLQLASSEVRKFSLDSCNDFQVEKFDEAELQDVGKWATAPPFGPLINRISPQAEQQLGKIQIDPITGERYMLVPIEVDLLVDFAKLCDMFDAEIGDIIQQGAQENPEREMLELEMLEQEMLEEQKLEGEMREKKLLADNDDEEDTIVLKVHQGEDSPGQVQKVVDLSVSIEAMSQTTLKNLLDREETLENSQKVDTEEKIQKKETQENSQKEYPEENSKKEVPQEKIQNEVSQNQSLKEESQEKMEAMIIVPPMNFWFKARFVEEPSKDTETAASSEEQQQN